MKWILIAALLLSTLAEGQTINRLTLEEALAIGKARSRTLRASAARAEGAQARAEEANASLLPSFRADGSYRRLSDVPPFAVRVPGSPVPFVISPIVLNNYALHAGVQQPIFTGFKLGSNVRAAELLAKAASLDRINDESDLVLAITVAYWTLHQTRETRRFVDENVARLETYAQDTENLLKAGMATRNDLLKIQVQLSNAKLTQIDAVNDLQVAMMNLNNLIGQELQTEIEPTSRPRVDSVEAIEIVSSPVSREAMAWHLRPDLQAMQARVDASEAGVRAAKGNWWPQIFFTGNYYYSRPNPRYMPTLDMWRDTWDIGVSVQMDIWNWGLTSAQIQQANASLLANRFMYEQMKENASLEVTRYGLAKRRARDKVAVSA
ncbi:MAG: outer rane efflux protein, partial [Bacteroidetes bacterium]|nr:outer rane efflux protein [Bacteroidota bacterium]